MKTILWLHNTTNGFMDFHADIGFSYLGDLHQDYAMCFSTFAPTCPAYAQVWLLIANWRHLYGQQRETDEGNECRGSSYPALLKIRLLLYLSVLHNPFIHECIGNTSTLR